jgi:hypothetical protein
MEPFDRLPSVIDGCLFGPNIFQLGPRDNALAQPGILRMLPAKAAWR